MPPIHVKSMPGTFVTMAPILIGSPVAASPVPRPHWHRGLDHAPAARESATPLRSPPRSPPAVRPSPRPVSAGGAAGSAGGAGGGAAASRRRRRRPPGRQSRPRGARRPRVAPELGSRWLSIAFRSLLLSPVPPNAARFAWLHGRTVALPSRQSGSSPCRLCPAVRWASTLHHPRVFALRTDVRLAHRTRVPGMLSSAGERQECRSFIGGQRACRRLREEPAHPASYRGRYTIDACRIRDGPPVSLDVERGS